MAKCIFCDENNPRKRIGLNVKGRKVPVRSIDVLIDICPDCGGMTLANTSFLSFLEGGYPSVSDADLQTIDFDALVDEAELPGRDEDEEKKWVDPSDFDNHPINQFYLQKFVNKPFGKWPKTRRLVHFLMMDPADREEAFGPFRCPSVRILPGGEIVFREGRTRFFLLKYAVSSRIPISIAPEYAANAADAGITLYDTKE